MSSRRSLRFSRRDVLGAGLAAGLLGVFSKIPFARAESKRPHFLLAIQIQEGVDNSYLFDGRAPKLTEKNQKQNYLLVNDANASSTRPDLFTEDKVRERTITCERSGCSALRTPFVDDLWNTHKDRFSIVNGVYMLRNNDGHEGNEAYLWGNSDRGGVDIFPPVVGKLLGETPLQSMILREFTEMSPAPKNLGGSVELRNAEFDALAKSLREGAKIDESSPLWKHVTERADVNALGGGLFAAGAGGMAQGVRRARRTSEALAGAGSANEGQPTVDPFARVIPLPVSVRRALELFGSGVTRVAMVVQTRFEVDLHDGTESQRSLVGTYTNIGKELLECLDLLTNTTFVDDDGTRIPFIDLTTFMVTSEFGRTNKNLSNPTRPVGGQGADHNPLANSVLIGGRGIVPGMVVGESDLRDCDDDGKHKDVSGAHRQKNAALVLNMGRPFDFAEQRLRTDLPETFDEKDYICMPSVTNTLLDVFEVPEDQRHKLGSTAAPILSVLRKSGR